ncbi:NADH dehydrogenase [ubiquinone] flavoprotein 3, mitochondrial [Suricata suricatta]|uniref:NADH dehydrogenase [ubiquinone] flavoprotein 3, mitochondrial n=1 Tax=Suricata suricatta TaxID=37032 RepID=UPI0011553218|nr:NADH dehydrogenase [ubiquinone] flavoprotein 3, mitochondrial [Suricata suricatta]
MALHVHTCSFFCQTVLLDTQAFRGLAPSVSLSAESGKSEKGLPPTPKKQSPPKTCPRGRQIEDVVEPKERGTLLATPTAAEWSRNASSPSSHPPVVAPGGAVAGPGPGPHGGPLITDEGPLGFLSRKTVVEFPQKVLSPLRKPGSDSNALQESSGDDSSSSSSSSSSSDSESEEEGQSARADPRVASRGHRGLPGPQASRPLEERVPGIGASAKEKARSQPDLTPPERPRQAKKKGDMGLDAHRVPGLHLGHGVKDSKVGRPLPSFQPREGDVPSLAAEGLFGAGRGWTSKIKVLLAQQGGAFFPACRWPPLPVSSHRRGCEQLSGVS